MSRDHRELGDESQMRPLMILIVLSVALLSGGGCDWLHRRPGRYLARSSSLPANGSEAGSGVNSLGCDYIAIWDTGPEPDQLIHIVISPQMRGFELAQGLSEGVAPQPRGVTSVPDGLYNEGVFVKTKPGCRVFVYTLFHRLRPVPLTSAEEATLTPGEVESLRGTPLWRDKIKSFIDAERGRADDGTPLVNP